MFKNIKKSLSWLLIISMLFTSNISSAFADSFDDAINGTSNSDNTPTEQIYFSSDEANNSSGDDLTDSNLGDKDHKFDDNSDQADPKANDGTEELSPDTYKNDNNGSNPSASTDYEDEPEEDSVDNLNAGANNDSNVDANEENASANDDNNVGVNEENAGANEENVGAKLREPAVATDSEATENTMNDIQDEPEQDPYSATDSEATENEGLEDFEPITDTISTESEATENEEIINSITTTDIISTDSEASGTTISTDSETEIVIDISLDDDIATDSNTTNVFGIGDHKHKECGVTGDCKHHTSFPDSNNAIPGTKAHSQLVRYDPIQEDTDVGNIDKHDHLYLTGDFSLLSSSQITREIWLCLNGYNLTLNISNLSYYIHITNCSEENISNVNFNNTFVDKIDMYGVNKNIKANLNFPAEVMFSVQKSTGFYLYGVELYSNNQNCTIVALNTNDTICNATLDNVTASNFTKCDSIIYSAANSKNVTINLIDFTCENNQFGNMNIAVHDVFHCNNYTTFNLYGNNYFGNSTITDDNFISSNFHVNVANGTTIIENIDSTKDIFTPQNGFIVQSGAMLSFRGNKSQGYKLFAPVALLVEEGAILEFVENEFADTNGYSGIKIPENNLFRGNLTITRNNITSNATFGEVLKVDKQLKISDGEIYIAENYKNGIIDLKNMGIHWGTTDAFITIENGKTISIGSSIQSIASEGTIVANWTDVKGYAEWENIFSYYENNQNIGIIYDSADDSVKTGNITSTHVVKFRDVNNNSFQNLPDRTVQDGTSLGVVTPIVDNNEAFLGWFTTKDVNTGELSNPWLDIDKVTQDMTLYAKTGIKYNYTLVYDKNNNDVEGNMPNKTGLSSGQRVYLDTCLYKKPNWIFKYWAENQDGSGQRWSNASSTFVYFPQSENETKTIYAIWEYEHKHKICGEKGDCVHTINEHPNTNNHINVTYTALENKDDLSDYSKTTAFYLIQDTTIDLQYLDRDLQICLNGYNLIVDTLIGGKMSITNCGNKAEFGVTKKWQSSVEIYGLNHNITYIDKIDPMYDLSIKDFSGNDNMYLYDVDMQFPNQQHSASDFKVSNNNNYLTFEKVNIIESKRKGDFIKIENSAYITINFIDCKISNKIFNDNCSLVNSESIFPGATINCKGNNIFENLKFYKHPMIYASNIDLNVKDGETIFRNIDICDYYFVIEQLGRLDIKEDASLILNGINVDAPNEFNGDIINLPIENSILGNLIITNCTGSSSMKRVARMDYALLNFSPPEYKSILNIGSGKIVIKDNFNTVGDKMIGLQVDAKVQDSPIIKVANGCKLNPQTRIDGIYFSTNQDNTGHLIDGWQAVSDTDWHIVDMFTAYNSSNTGYTDNPPNGLIVANDNDNVVIKKGIRFKVKFDTTNIIQDVQLDSKLVFCTPSLTNRQEFKYWYYKKYVGHDYFTLQPLYDDKQWDFENDRIDSDILNKIYDPTYQYKGTLIMYQLTNTVVYYNLHYDANGGAGHMDDRTDMKADHDETLDDNLFTKDGCVFLGWCSRTDLANPQDWKSVDHWDDGDKRFNQRHVQDGELKIIYAVWKPISWTLHFDANGGSQSSAPADITGIPSGESRVIPATKPTRNNYKFLGWATSSTTTVVYQTGNSYTAIIDPAKFNPVGNEPVKSLYAVWQNIKYTVTYDKNGATGQDMPKSDGTAGEDLILSANTYTKTGYRFRGWDEVSNPTNPASPKYPVTSDLKMNLTLTEQDSTDIKVYAIWTQISVNVFYRKNDSSGLVNGMVPVTTDPIYSNVPYTLADNSGGANGSLTYEGKYLLGWATESDATNARYALGSTITLNIPESDDGTSIVFYAIWGNVPYKIKLNNNGGVGDTVEIPAQSDIDVNLPANSFTRVGYKFLGWNTDATVTNDNWKTVGEHYDNLAVINRTVTAADVNSIYNLYAVWKRITYTLQYDANGGSQSSAPADITGIPSGESRVIPATKPTRNNYKFLGWASVSNATIADYIPSSNFSHIVDPDTYDPTLADPIKTIYAVWKLMTYKVVYDKNTGEGNDMPQSVGTSGNALTLSNNLYTKAGYRFLGWDENSTVTAPTYSSTSSMDMTKVLTEAQDDMTIKVYAIWKQISYNVIYNENAGTNTVIGSTPSQMTGYSGIALTLATNQGNLGMAGKYLLGWDENSAAINATYTLGGSMTRNVSESNDGELVVLYAVWGNVPYKIKLNNNGGVGDTVEIPAQSDIDSNLPNNTFTKVNYKFIGWSENANIDPATFDPTAIGNYPVSGGIVNRTVEASQANTIYNLYAVWQKYTYTLKYNINAGTDTTNPASIQDEVDVNSGENKAISTISPTRNDYAFLGWADTHTATVAQYQPGGNYSATVDSDGQTKTIYAVWAYYYPYTVHFNSNGGEGDMVNIIATSAVTSPLPANVFTKDGFVFVGWSETQTAISAQYSSNIYKKFDNAGNVVNLYAVWKKAPNVASGGGSMSGANVPNSIIHYVPTTHENANAIGFYDVQHNNVVDTYYRNQNGTNIEGWLRTYDAKWYLFEYEPTVNVLDRGKMIRGFRYVTDAWFFFKGNGQMATDFTNINNNTYYFETTRDRNEGKMATGWKIIGENWYYFAFDGVMLRNQITPDGYRVGQDGAWIKDGPTQMTTSRVVYQRQ